MKLKEIIMKYKEGNSLDRLGIVGNIVTIISAVVALVTGQLLTIKFIFDESTFMLIGFYIIAMGVTLLLIYLFWALASICIKALKPILFGLSVVIILFGFLSLIISNIWYLVLSFQ